MAKEISNNQKKQIGQPILAKQTQTQNYLITYSKYYKLLKGYEQAFGGESCHNFADINKHTMPTQQTSETDEIM